MSEMDKIFKYTARCVKCGKGVKFASPKVELDKYPCSICGGARKWDRDEVMLKREVRDKETAAYLAHKLTQPDIGERTMSKTEKTSKKESKKSKKSKEPRSNLRADVIALVAKHKSGILTRDILDKVNSDRKGGDTTTIHAVRRILRLCIADKTFKMTEKVGKQFKVVCK